MQASTISRRRFLETTAIAATATMLPLGHALGQTKPKYTRYNVLSTGGKKALASYARAIGKMLALPPDHPQNWLRNAFIHFMDCPHGNWWFYVWHRGYLGYFEETIRNLSGDPTFAIPYWDWTAQKQPEIPAAMFDGVLTPRDAAFEPFTGDLGRFTAYIQPALKAYWDKLSAAQREQLNHRGYTEFDLLWNDVNGYSPKADNAVAGNLAYAVTCNARYLTRQNPKLDAKTSYDVSPFVIYAGLLPTEFNSSEGALSFTSVKTPSHNTAPPGPNVFSTLEGLPHNKVHNYIGGVGPLDFGPYGNMANNLSPIDPVFFLHHSNMDRLWDIWTRKQQHQNLPWLPKGDDLKTLASEPFLFYVDGKGQYVGESHAGDYFDMARFGYAYEPGFGEDVINPPHLTAQAAQPSVALTASVQANSATVGVPPASIQKHLDAKTKPTLFTKITLPRPESTGSMVREFDVIVGAPENVTEVNADSPYYGGTIAFFPPMPSMTEMSMDATFVVPLPTAPQAFATALAATPDKSAPANLSIRVVAAHGRRRTAPVLKSLTVHAL
jgi:tyrosinase